LRETGDERGALFINGTIDLAFEAGGTIYVVDFKTGKQEKAAEHAYQMAVYHKAARDLWQKDTRLILYWLRTGNAVEVTTPEHPAL
jgi:ATP-dependent exoDNAse (exonuclease V) beta subunit